MTPVHSQDGAELRAELIAAGTLRPARDDGLTPLRLPPGTYVLRLDDCDRGKAHAHVTRWRDAGCSEEPAPRGWR